MSDRKLLALMAALDIALFAATIYVHLTWKPIAHGPQMMGVGQLFGWIGSIGLLLLTIALAFNWLRPSPTSQQAVGDWNI